MSETPLYLDLETFSSVPINQGAHAYAEGAEIMIVVFAVGDGEVRTWDCTNGSEMPDDLWQMLNDPKRVVVMHNGGNFDRIIMQHVWKFNLPPSRIHDTMVQALAHGLPGSLGQLCEVMHVSDEDSKDKRGKGLINLFCKFRPKNMKVRRATRETNPIEWAEFLEYAQKDIPSMRAIYKKMPKWNYPNKEHDLWVLDQIINSRGILVDLKLVDEAIDTVARAQVDLAARTVELTDGDVGSTTQRDKLLSHLLTEHGVTLPDMQASTLERRINDATLPWAARELLAIRLQATTTSTSKYKALKKMVSSDGVLRGTTQFCGASRTGRWSGRGFQIQNLPSKNLPKAAEVDAGIEAICAGGADLVYTDVMKMISAAVRGCLIARPGKKLVVSDLSNIEGRAAAWLAGEDWKVQAFYDLDNGTGADLYRLAYAKSFSIDVSAVDGGKDKGPQRQIGKVQELALQYEGGVGAFVTFSLVYGIDLDAMAADAWDSIPERILREANQAWGWALKKRATLGLERNTYIVCDSLKRLWREAHPEISSYWSELSTAAVRAIQNPKTRYHARKISFYRTGAWLRMELPSGRVVCYASPAVDEKGKISYLGVNNYTRRWQRTFTYGGKFFENLCQAVARDVMAANMPTMEAEGYAILGTVHDEVITEALRKPSLSAGDLSRILATNPEWAEGMPLSASGFESQRYKKD